MSAGYAAQGLEKREMDGGYYHVCNQKWSREVLEATGRRGKPLALAAPSVAGSGMGT